MVSLSFLQHHRLVRRWLLGFLRTRVLGGVALEVFPSAWKYKSTFSLDMYLDLGWRCLVCRPNLVKVLS